jgi:hypothetical protein
MRGATRPDDLARLGIYYDDLGRLSGAVDSGDQIPHPHLQDSIFGLARPIGA